MVCRAVLVLLLSAPVLLGELAEPPAQPKGGPGGAEYRHARVRESVHGKGSQQYWIFEPDAPAKSKAPLIIFLHGFSVMDPHGYKGWIDHLVRRGNVVIYPRYQGSLFTPPAEFHPNCLTAVRAALAHLGENAVDLNRVATVGHSAGGVLAVKYAAAAEEVGLPVPKAAVIVQPGQGPKNGLQVLPFPLAMNLPLALRLIVAVGDTDFIVGDGSARRLWRDTASLKERLFVTVQTDLHGKPPLHAGHLSPMSADLELADSVDWRGWWRLLDEACEAAFAGRSMRLAPEMGDWSDGRPVKPLKIESDRPL